MSDRNVPVLIVGGSLVGLSTSLLLAAQEVPHLLVERHRGTAVHPRAASFHQRTGVALGCPVGGYRVAPDRDLVDKGETFAQAYGLGADGAVLVRPDAVVAWRAPADAGDPRAAVEEALRRLLFRQP